MRLVKLTPLTAHQSASNHRQVQGAGSDCSGLVCAGHLASVSAQMVDFISASLTSRALQPQ
eukprot:12883311-Prorocentrum_lima.AAC.1